MPLPTPKKGESKNEFVQRCVTDPVMEKEFPDETQRVAVCYNLWSDKRNKRRRKKK